MIVLFQILNDFEDLIRGGVKYGHFCLSLLISVLNLVLIYQCKIRILYLSNFFYKTARSRLSYHRTISSDPIRSDVNYYNRHSVWAE